MRKRRIVVHRWAILGKKSERANWTLEHDFESGIEAKGTRRKINHLYFATRLIEYYEERWQ